MSKSVWKILRRRRRRGRRCSKWKWNKGLSARYFTRERERERRKSENRERKKELGRESKEGKKEEERGRESLHFFLSLHPCRKRSTSRRWRRSWICRWTSCLHSSTRSHSRSHTLSRMDCSTTFYPSSTRSFSRHTSPNTCNSSSISISATTQVGSLISRSFFSKTQFSFSRPSIISLTLSSHMITIAFTILFTEKAEDFLGYLFNIFLDRQVHETTRLCALQYIASFIARGPFVHPTLIR
jgi:hypothetical protein